MAELSSTPTANDKHRSGKSASVLPTESLAFGRICSQIEVENTANPLKGSFTAFLEFNDVLSDATFPCLFGRRAWRDKTNRFLFCACIADGGLVHFRQGVFEYTEFVKSTPVEKRLFAPLVVFIDGLVPPNDTHHFVAWQLLQGLIDSDPESWPNNVPVDPNDSLWSFCFNGVQLFFNISTPAHTVLRSRCLGTRLTLVINPRENFDVVASSQAKSGQLIREKIRERVCTYNEGFLPSELGAFGDSNNFEWKQFQLGEPGLPSPRACPLEMKKTLKEVKIS